MTVDAVVDSHVEDHDDKVVTEMPEDTSVKSPQKTNWSTTVL